MICCWEFKKEDMNNDYYDFEEDFVLEVRNSKYCLRMCSKEMYINKRLPTFVKKAKL